MAAFFIDFEWWRYPGYRFLTPRPSAKARRVHPRFAVAASIDPHGLACQHSPRIACQGGNAVPYRPLDNFDTLCTIFANTVWDANSLLQFVEKFGPLTNEGLNPHRGEPVDTQLENAEAMRAFLEYAANGKTVLVEMLETMQAGWPLGLDRLTLQLALDPATRTPKLRLAPGTLMDALWIQLGQLMSGASVVRQCHHCGKWFDAGPRTGRRLDAKFCSNEHKVTFHSLKRSRGNNDA